MGCGCRKNRGASQSPAGRYEVWVNGVFTGRRYTSSIRAQQMADRLGGEVRAI